MKSNEIIFLWLVISNPLGNKCHFPPNLSSSCSPRNFCLPLNINKRFLIRLSLSILKFANPKPSRSETFWLFFLTDYTCAAIQFSLFFLVIFCTQNVLILGEIILSNNKILLYCIRPITQHFRLEGSSIEINNHEIHHIKLPQFFLFFCSSYQRIFLHACTTSFESFFNFFF